MEVSNLHWRFIMKMKIKKIQSSFIFVLLCASSAIYAESGREIMKKVYEQSRIHTTSESDVAMSIQDSEGEERERFFSFKKKITGDSTSSLIKFYKPADVKGTGLLTNSNEKTAQSKQWLYLPSLRSLNQLNSEDKNKSFMGSDFSTSDVAGRELDKDEHKLLKSEGDYHYILSTPKKKDAYSKLEVKVNKKINVVVEVTFYDLQGKKLKTLENKKFSKEKGMYVCTLSQMKNHQTGSLTILTVNNIEVGQEISENDVGLKSLKN